MNPAVGEEGRDAMAYVYGMLLTHLQFEFELGSTFWHIRWCVCSCLIVHSRLRCLDCYGHADTLDVLG